MNFKLTITALPLCFLLLLPAISDGAEPVDDTAPNADGFVDHFKGKYHKAWEIINQDFSHISLDHRPNALTITTQQGGIWHRTNDVKNLFVIENPFDVDDDFVMTTRLDHFNPQQNYNQAGLLCYDDMDNYLAFSLQWDKGNGGRTLCQWAETDGQDIEPQLAQQVEIINRVWLRISKKKNHYTASVSFDGKEYEELGATLWGNHGPAKIGLIAKNGVSRRAPDVAASFDFFEIRPAMLDGGEDDDEAQPVKENSDEN